MNKTSSHGGGGSGVQSWPGMMSEEIWNELGHKNPDTPDPLFFFFLDPTAMSRVLLEATAWILNSEWADACSDFSSAISYCLSLDPCALVKPLAPADSHVCANLTLCLTQDRLTLIWDFITQSLLPYVLPDYIPKNSPHSNSRSRPLASGIHTIRDFLRVFSTLPFALPVELRFFNKPTLKEKKWVHVFLPFPSRSPPTNKWNAFSALSVLRLC